MQRLLGAVLQVMYLRFLRTAMQTLSGTLTKRHAGHRFGWNCRQSFKLNLRRCLRIQLHSAWQRFCKTRSRNLSFHLAFQAVKTNL